MYFHPDRMSPEFEMRIVRWLEANGCRHWIARVPFVLRGNVVEYTALARKDDRSLDRQVRGDDIVPLGHKRLRIRIPLRAVA